jgi:hypothetical protein
MAMLNNQMVVVSFRCFSLMLPWDFDFLMMGIYLARLKCWFLLHGVQDWPCKWVVRWCFCFHDVECSYPEKKWKATYQWISWNRLIIVVYTSSCPDVCGFLPPKDLPISCGWHSHSHVALRCPVLQEGTPLAGMEAPAIPRSPRSSGAQGWRWCHGLLCEVGLFHCVKYGLWYGNTKS